MMALLPCLLLASTLALGEFSRRMPERGVTSSVKTGSAYPSPPSPPSSCTVSLTKQESKQKCTAGQSYGCTGNATSAAVWVLGGCRGQFMCNGGGASHRSLECASDAARKATCPCNKQPPSPPCTGPRCFTFTVDWASGTNATTLPTGLAIGANFSVRKLEAIVWTDGKTYAYVDIVPYADPYYPASYSTEVGVFSSPDGRTGWAYHGIVVARGAPGAWDGGGIASPGAAVAADGSVIVGYAGENSPRGGINRGIGVAVASHPLGPFVKEGTPIASPKTICGGEGRCDDVIMQSRPDGVHIYHSVKGGCTRPGCGIRHRVSTDSGRSWGNSTLVLSATLQPGHDPAESIAGKWFPEMCGGKGGMVIITDGCAGVGCLHAYISKTPGDMTNFVAATQPGLGPAEHPPFGPPGSITKGDWASAAGQIGFIPDADDNVVGVTYSLWNGDRFMNRHQTAMGGYTHTVYRLNVSTPPPQKIADTGASPTTAV